MKQIILFTDEDGSWTAKCLTMPGVVGTGTTMEEALARIKDVIDSSNEIRNKYGDPARMGLSHYTLEELVAGITEENRHDEVDFGPPVGKELI